MVPVNLPDGRTIEAKLDTGAELSCFYCGYIHALDPEQAQYIERRRFSGMTGNDEYDVYFVTFDIGGRSFAVEVAAGSQQRNVIGMNLLNEILAEFDGPSAQFTLTL